MSEVDSRIRSSRREEAHFKENQWNRASYSENGLGARTSVRPARWQHRAGRNKFRAPPSSPRVSRLSERRHPCRPPRAFHPLWRTKFMGTHVGCYDAEKMRAQLEIIPACEQHRVW